MRIFALAIVVLLSACKTPVQNSKVIDEPTLRETYWKLVEVNGSKVTVDSTMRREPHMILHNDKNRVSGNGGCNNFGGTFSIENTNILFSQMVSTKMMCPSMAVEDAFLKMLGTARSYSITGGELSLYDSNHKLLARLVPVYLK